MAKPKLSEEEERLVAKFQEHQQKAARPTMAEEVRTLLDRSLCYGTLSTNSEAFPGFPTGSVVGFELDEAGLPFFVFSTMSAHTRDVIKDGRVSLTVLASDFKGAAEGRVVLIGTCKKLSADSERQAKLRERYLARHKDAYWIDFGDFSYFQMESLQAIRYVGGFAMAGSVTPEEYQQAKPDPLAAFAAPVMKHMNDDHADSTAAMVRHYTGMPCTAAEIVSMDRLGMTVKATLTVAGGGVSKVRLPYPGGEVTDRKAIKEVLVEMTKAAAAGKS
jgi:putative heme iron utilization protein